MNKVFRVITSFLTIICCLAGSMTTLSAAENDGTVPHVTFTNEPNLSPDLRVTKTVQSAAAGYEVPEYVRFQFVLKLNGEIAAGEKYTLSDRNGEIIRKSGNNTVDFETDENGVFTLEDGQTAVFEYVGNNVPYEVIERNTYLCPQKDAEGNFQPDSSGYVLYQKDSSGNETLLHPEYRYQLRGMEKDGYAPVSPVGGSSGNVVPDMESVKFVNQYTPKDLNATELKVTKNISFPAEYEMPQAVRNTLFWFHLEIEDSANREYTVLNPIDELVETVRYTDEDGDFALYPGETAVFADVPGDAGYRVSEIMEPVPDVILPDDGGTEMLPGDGDDDSAEMLSLSIDRGLIGGGGGILDSGMGGGTGGNLSGGGLPVLRPMKGWPAGWWPVGEVVKEGDRIPASPVTFYNANTSFRVRKTMDDNTEPENVEFTFQLVDARNNPMAGAVYYRCNMSTKELLLNQDDSFGGGGILLQSFLRPIRGTEEWTTDENGYFRLAAGEEAIFCGIEPGTSYTVKEIGRLIEVNGEMKVDPSYAEQPPQSGTVSAAGQLTTQNFVNSRIDMEGTLAVTKQVENAEQEGSGTEDAFHFLLYKRLKTTADVKNELTRLVKANQDLEDELGSIDAIKEYTGEQLSEKVGILLAGEGIREELGWKLTPPTLGDSGPEGTAASDKNWYYSSEGAYREVYVPVTGAVYSIVTGDITENHAAGPDAEKGWGAGEFAVKAGQTARFATLSVEGQYRVEEVGLTIEYTPKPAVTAGFNPDSSEEQTRTEVIGGTVQTITRKADGSYEYIQTAVMPREGLAFTFTNLYKPKKVDLQLLKVDEQKAPRQGAEFMLYLNKGKEDKVLPEGADDTFRYTTDENGIVRIENLKPGTYWLYEEKAPSGYRILTDPIEITITQTRTGLEVQVDGILYQAEDGADPIETGSSTVSAVQILTDRGTDSTTGKELNDELILTIPNIYLYELPNSGGIGIYWYSIGGMLLMMAAALILYRYKHEGEVLKD
nr:SpaA isopeptide-forming pilin-related protein [uncultured Acetatifactor sp.]